MFARIRFDELSNPVARLALPNGLTFYTESKSHLASARYIRREIFRARAYQRRGFELENDHAVLDVAANMGISVLWFAPKVPRGRVGAIEPGEAVRDLQRNVRLNALANVSVVPIAAAGPGTRTVRLIESPGFNAIGYVASTPTPFWTPTLVRWLYGAHQSQRMTRLCPAATLDEIAAWSEIDRIDLLKMDCEGAEYDIFAGISPEHWARVERMVLEFHEQSPQHHHEILSNTLRAHGFEVQVVTHFFSHAFLKTGFIWAKRRRGGRGS